jgi:hypothetical protein
MNKKDVAKTLRKKLTEAIRSLPGVEYQRVSLFKDATTQEERDHEEHNYCAGGALHIIELIVEEKRT